MLILLAVAAGGCSPLRNINAERHATLDIADSTLTALVRQELERLSVCLAAQTQSAGMLASLMYDMAFPGEDREEPAADGYLAGRIFKGPAL